MQITDYLLSASATELVGLMGFCLYVTNYTLLTHGRLNSKGTTYFALNIVAASCVLIGLTQSFNLASALIQAFWVVASGWAVIVRLRQNRQVSRRQLRRSPGLEAQ